MATHVALSPRKWSAEKVVADTPPAQVRLPCGHRCDAVEVICGRQKPLETLAVTVVVEILQSKPRGQVEQVRALVAGSMASLAVRLRSSKKLG